MSAFLMVAGMIAIVVGLLCGFAGDGGTATFVLPACIVGGLTIMGLGAVVDRLDQLLDLRRRDREAATGGAPPTAPPHSAGQEPKPPARYRIDENGVDHPA